MGHEYIEFEGRFVQLPDMDIWTLRHFFLEAAHSLSPPACNADEATLLDLRGHFVNWDWLGPGVFTGTDLSDFVGGRAARRDLLALVFDRTSDRLRAFGEAIPLDYLERHINTAMAHYLAAQPTSRFLRAINRLREMLCDQGNKTPGT